VTPLLGSRSSPEASSRETSRGEGGKGGEGMGGGGGGGRKGRRWRWEGGGAAARSNLVFSASPEDYLQQ
jgi:hypothetical protein